ncbi:hypothetical protein B0E43_13140 [Algoriphagus sp. A40]|nr:hypothetical protein B0E43_13140 [Algoriphagus sp. A40]
MKPVWLNAAQKGSNMPIIINSFFIGLGFHGFGHKVPKACQICLFKISSSLIQSQMPLFKGLFPVAMPYNAFGKMDRFVKET